MVAFRVISLVRAVALFFSFALFGIIVALPSSVAGQEGPPPQLSITLALPKEELPWGAESTFSVTVANEGSEPATGVQLQLSRNRTLVYTGKVAAPEREAAAVTLELGDIEAGKSIVTEVGFRIIGVPRNGWAWVHAQAKGVGTPAVNAKEQLSIQPFEPQEAVISPAGENLAVENGRVAFAFPPEWYEREATFSFSLLELYQLLPGDKGSVVAFSVEVKDGAPVEDFAAPVAVTIKAGDLLPPGSEEVEQLVVRTQAREDDPLRDVAATYDAAAGTISFTTTHFSSFLLTVDPEPWQFGYTPPGASAFTGAGTYSYPIEVPPGISGLTPDLTLNYNSRAVDGLEFPVMADGFGLGWSLPQAEIINGNASQMYEDGNTCCHNFDANRFTLVLGGVSYRLEPADLDPNGRHGTYQALGGPELSIQYLDSDDDNVTGEYWRVRTADGTIYLFGDTRDAEQVVAPISIEPNHNSQQPRNQDFAAVSWKLSRIKNVNGHAISYSYIDKCGTESGQPRAWTVDVGNESWQQCTKVDTALSEIEYNYNGTTAQTIIAFSYNNLNAGPVKESRLMTAGYFRPTEIAIHKSGTATPISRYTFDYTAIQRHWIEAFTISTEFWMLSSITRVGSNGSSTLPVEQFSYGHETTTCYPDHSDPPEDQCPRLLTLINNGYGGVTQLKYARIVDDDPDDDDSSGEDWYHVWDSYRWDGVAHEHGTSDRPQTRMQYFRSGYIPCYDRTGEPCRAPSLVDAESKALVGFNGTVIKTYEPSGTSGWTTLSQERLEFSIEDYWLSGQLTKREEMDASGDILTREILDWTYWKAKPLLEERITQLLNGGAMVVNKTKYTYYTLAGDYGGLKEVEEIDVQANWSETKRRCTRFVYGHNTNNGAWLVNRQLSEKTFEGACSGTEVARTLYRYGQSTAPTDTNVGTLAELTWILRWDGANYLSEQRIYHHPWNPGSQAAAEGLLKEVRTFSEVSTDSAYVAQNKLLQTIRYTYNTLGLATKVETDPDGTQLPTLVEDITYGGTFPWLIGSVTDSNGVKWQYSYDTFGRLAKKVYPGDTLSDPTISYLYYDNGGLDYPGPFLVGTFYKDDILKDERHFYDGFGRLVQEQKQRYKIAGGANERDVVTSYGYDARGLLVCQSVPYWDGNPYNGELDGPYQTDLCDERPAKTTTIYAGDGRLMAVTAPNGKTTSYVYGVTTTITSFDYDRLWRVQSFDANDHVVNRFSNSFGQLVLVRENKGDNPNNYEKYADTRYEYNTVGNLIEVLTNAPSTDSQPGSGLRRITMEYDTLGRKTKTADPDLGTWTYAYDTRNNLVRQDIGRDNIVLCFYYDQLNRLTQKIRDVSPGTTCPTSPAGSDIIRGTYDYDTAANGIGKLARVEWGSATTDNYETFTYDNEGRPKKHTRKINGQTFTLETTLYDLLDRPLNQKYDDGEVVKLTYDNEGPETLKAGTTNLVIEVGYSALGQVAWLERAGSARDTTYSYHDQSENFRLHKIIHGNEESDSFPDFTYGSYDNVGNILSMAIRRDGSTTTYSYGYDELNRLLSVSGGYTRDYTYNELGNITSANRSGTLWTYVYDTTNPIISRQRLERVNGLGLVADTAASYDGNGNLKDYYIGSTHYVLVYAAENQLTSMTVGSQTTEFYYDANGQRVRTKLPNGTNIYTPFPQYEETDPTSGATTKRSNYYMNGQLVAIKVVIGSNTTRYFTYADHLGSVSALGASNGDFILGSYARYDPFGSYVAQPQSSTNPDLTSRGFTGHQHNNTGTYDLGLIYMNARYYMPEIGRFISPDTMLPNPNNPQGINRYAYGLNSPLEYKDPSGHWVESALDIAFIAYDLYDIQQNGLNWENGLSLVADVGGLIVPVATGGGLAVRAAFHADDAAKIVSHADEVVDAAKALSRVDNTVDAAKGLSAFSRAAEFGIKPYNELTKLTKGTGLEAHHLIEKRFATTLGLKAGKIPSIALTAIEHQEFTNAWRQLIGYVTDNKALTTATATREDIWAAAQQIYAKYPELLEAVRTTLFSN